MTSFGEITIFDPNQIHFFNENTFYQNNDLSFQIFKPDDSWEIHQAQDDFTVDEMASLKSKGYLGGIYLEKQHDTRFLITVFKIEKEEFMLKDYLEKQIILMDGKSNVKITQNQVSKSNDWAVFSMDMGATVENRYGEQLLFFKGDKLYMLHYSGNAPENISTSDKHDFYSIFDSFEVL